MKTETTHAPHLVLQEFVLRPGEEWKPQSPGWSFIQILAGEGYWLDEQANLDLPAGTVVLAARRLNGMIRASQIGELSIAMFRAEPDLMAGLITASEQSIFENMAARLETSRMFLPPVHPIATRFKLMCSQNTRRDIVFRFELLNLFVRAFSEKLERQAVAETSAPTDARERLQKFMEETLASELMNLSFGELVQRVNCTPRHLSRIFHEVAGMSFREKQSRLRLAKASELLATTEFKVVDVALESGYQSLSLFSLMFRKRFGLSPGKWRKKHRKNNDKSQPRRRMACADS